MHPIFRSGVWFNLAWSLGFRIGFRALPKPFERGFSSLDASLLVRKYSFSTMQPERKTPHSKDNHLCFVHLFSRPKEASSRGDELHVWGEGPHPAPLRSKLICARIFFSAPDLLTNDELILRPSTLGSNPMIASTSQHLHWAHASPTIGNEYALRQWICKPLPCSAAHEASAVHSARGTCSTGDRFHLS